MAQVDGGDARRPLPQAGGVDVIFTLCGGHIQNIYDGCQDNDIRIVDVRHEQVAGHAAEGWSRANRRPGVGRRHRRPRRHRLPSRPSPTPTRTAARCSSSAAPRP